MERLARTLPEQDERFLEKFSDHPWYPFPTWMPTLLLGDLLAFSLLILLMIRQRRLAEAAGQAGEIDQRILHGRKAGIYAKLIKISLALTVIPHLLWVTVPALPGWVAYYTPLPIFMGLVIWVPFLVWLAPLAALAVELMRNTRDLSR